ncbi:hypothetical protein PNI0008_02309, partial [Streptococcus pneumoniae PNI0008]
MPSTFLYSSKISSNHVSFHLQPQNSIFELTSSVLSTTSKQCFEQP